jgi:hypothetical protein
MEAERDVSYSEKLRDPRWQKMRLIVLERDAWRCRLCWATKTTLHVHHPFYMKGTEPWEYASEVLLTLCSDCHAKISPKAISPETGVAADDGVMPQEERDILILLLQWNWVWTYVKSCLNPRYLTNAGVRASIVGLIEYGTLFHPLLPELRKLGLPTSPPNPIEILDQIFYFERAALRSQRDLASKVGRFDECARISSRLREIDRSCGEDLCNMDQDSYRKEEERKFIDKKRAAIEAH